MPALAPLLPSPCRLPLLPTSVCVLVRAAIRPKCHIVACDQQTKPARCLSASLSLSLTHALPCLSVCLSVWPCLFVSFSLDHQVSEEAVRLARQRSLGQDVAQVGGLKQLGQRHLERHRHVFHISWPQLAQQLHLLTS